MTTTINPRLSFKDFKLSKNKFQNQYFEFDFAREALSLLAKIYKVKNNPRIAIPSFICDVVPNEFLKNKWVPIFFKTKNRYQISLYDLEFNSLPKIDILLIPHYFGMRQDLKDIKIWCVDNDIILIEDCTHLPLIPSTEHLYGNIGDFAIYSMRKFYPGGKGYLRCNKDIPENLIHLLKYRKKNRLKKIAKDFIAAHIDNDKIFNLRKKNVEYFLKKNDSSVFDEGYYIDEGIIGLQLGIPLRLKRKISDQENLILSEFGYIWPNFPEGITDNQNVFVFPIHQSIEQKDIHTMLNSLKDLYII